MLELSQIPSNNEEINSQIEIFNSKEEMKRSIMKFCNGDLYIIGRIWLEVLKSVLVGAKLNIIPRVEAAAPPPEPKCPPPMRYKDLPLYTSPHYEYKDYLAEKEKCPKANVSLLHEYLLPSVRSFRIDTQKSFCQIGCGFANAWRQLKLEMADHEKNFKHYIRDPDKVVMRQAIVGLGIASGYYLTRRRGLPSRIFGTTLGGFLAGAVTFPDESDRAFRDLLYRGGKMLIVLYNNFCGDDYALEERLSCRDDLPAIPPPRQSQCPIKK